MTVFELRPASSAKQLTEAVDLVWERPRSGAGALESDLEPCLGALGQVPAAAIDLVRIASAAYLADQRQKRPESTFSRVIGIAVHVRDASLWPEDRLEDVADLLTSLSGDHWTVQVLDDASGDCPEAPDHDSADRVALLSGGLDSFAGAALSSKSDQRVLYFGHWDNPTIKHAQDKVRRWFDDQNSSIEYVQVRHGKRGPKAEPSTRTRSFLFLAMATALAAARSAAVIEVAENGYTSLNVPLGPERGGPLSTRSTHPMTIHRFNELLRELGLAVAVENPYQYATKGELVSDAAKAAGLDFAAGAALTFSCGKMDGARYKGGNPNSQCGLCVSCQVRRASLIAAGISDDAEYLFQRLAGSSRDKLIRNRSSDINAIARGVARGIDDAAVIALAPFPSSYDLDRGVQTAEKGLEELSLVPRP